MRLNRFRRSVLIVGATLVAGVLSPIIANAQHDYPNRSLRWIVGFSAGGGSDFLARTVGNALSEELGQPIVIENRPGAGAMIGAQTAARAPADGYTLWSGDMATLVFNPKLRKDVPYSVSDFKPVGQMARFNLVLVASADAPFSTLPEAVDLIRKNPGKFSYASVGSGTNHHVVMELFKQAADLDIVHIPYKGLAPSIQAILGEQVELAPIDSASARAYIQDKKVKPLAVTSSQRLADFPDIPTMKELGYDEVEMYAWQGLFVPAATPQLIVDKLATNLEKALSREKVRQALLDYGLELTYTSPKEFEEYLDQQIDFWGKVIDNANISIEN